MKAGIYQIIDKKDVIYYGSTNSFKNRKYKHFRLLRRNEHPNNKLQNAFNKYGENYFNFEPIEEVKNTDHLITIEQTYLDMLFKRTEGKRYNSNPIASQPPILKGVDHPMWGKKHSEETKKKMSEAHKGDKNPMFGKQVFLGKKHSEESKRKMSMSHKEKVLSEEHKKNLSKSKIGNSNRSKLIRQICTKTNEVLKEYSSIKEAEKDGFNRAAIGHVLKERAKTSGGYRWEYKQ